MAASRVDAVPDMEQAGEGDSVMVGVACDAVSGLEQVGLIVIVVGMMAGIRHVWLAISIRVTIEVRKIVDVGTASGCVMVTRGRIRLRIGNGAPVFIGGGRLTNDWVPGILGKPSADAMVPMSALVTELDHPPSSGPPLSVKSLSIQALAVAVADKRLKAVLIFRALGESSFQERSIYSCA